MTSRDFLRSRVFAIGLAAAIAVVVAGAGWYLLASGGGAPAGVRRWSADRSR